MSKNERFSRLILKRTTVHGESGTTTASTDHTLLPAWKTTDLYQGELFVNLNDHKLFINAGNGGVKEIPLSYFPVTPVDGEGLVYNGTGDYWTNRAAVGPIHDLSGLTDVLISDPYYVPGGPSQFLILGASRWFNSFVTLNDISGVTVTNPSAYDVLKFNGTKWVNAPIYFDITGFTLNSLKDVVVTGETIDQVLRFDGTNWVNSGITGLDGSSGTNGTNGSSGSSGTNGTSGSSGTNGTSGSSGTNGTNGTSGSSGISFTGITISNPITGQTLKYSTGNTWVNSYDSTITEIIWDKFDQSLTIETQDSIRSISIEGRPIDYITGGTTLLDSGYYTLLCYSGTTIVLPTASGNSNGNYYGTIFKVKLIQSGVTTITCENLNDYIFDDITFNYTTPPYTHSILGKTLTFQCDGLSTWYIL